MPLEFTDLNSTLNPGNRLLIIWVNMAYGIIIWVNMVYPIYLLLE